eukprot:CAMPEP_0171064890 /NCGR_PEP_ID=MMETSP0766_2-20121228/6545_1 /TAXON_ID=439317 /ORGANISM="Gambierdiscus australes, Strain CAWD 149" /LENGTH=382 /DNA_ID=CAMNT_0011520959 /DNA_START=49 /DNA_END=1197 /DNA_ORIENTATION=-
MAADSKEERAAGTTVNVDIRSLSGALLSLNVDRGSTVADVKAEIQRQWETPALYQILTCGDSVLANAESIQAIAESSSALSMTMLVSHEEVSKELDSGESLRQLPTLQALANLGSRAGDFAVDAVCALLDGPDTEVFTKAAQTLVSIAGPENKSALAALTKMVGSRNGTKRRLAVTALGSLARPGDKEVLEGLTHHIENSMTCARCCALDALAVVGHGQESAIAMIIAQLQHLEVRVRTFAVRALATAAIPGDAASVAAAVSRLEDSAVEVRIAAVRTTAKLASSADEAAVAGVMQCLEDRNTFVRMAAVKALAALVPSVAESTLAAKLEDSNEHVRRAATKALAFVSKSQPKPGKGRRRRRKKTAKASSADATGASAQSSA